jgi:menaquinone-9 beta-reductase
VADRDRERVVEWRERRLAVVDRVDGRGKLIDAVLEGRSSVLIVGAGPAGCAAGIVLARAGVDVCVIDRATFPRDKTCGDALSQETVALLDRLGLRDALAATPHAIVRQAAAVFPDGSRITRDYDPPGWIMRRLDLDDLLRRALEDAGARLVQGVRAASLVQRGGRVAGARGPQLDWQADVVVAADGYATAGLDAVGAAKPAGRYLAVSATAYYRGVSFPYGDTTADHCFDAEIPYGYGWVFPAVDGVSNVGVYLRADAYRQSGATLGALLDGFLARQATRFAGAERVGDVRAWSLPLGPRPIPHGAPGLLLVGDAGGFVDPLSGEGIWQALHTGILAGETALAALRGDGLDAARLRDYEQRCWTDVGRPSRSKALVQRAMAAVVRHRLYRVAGVRAALSFGYRRRAFEMSKA